MDNEQAAIDQVKGQIAALSLVVVTLIAHVPEREALRNVLKQVLAPSDATDGKSSAFIDGHRQLADVFLSMFDRLPPEA